MTGTSVGQGSGRDVATVAYQTGGGALQWSRREGTAGDDYAADLRLGADEQRLYVAGTVGIFTDAQDIRTVAYRAPGGGRVRAMDYDSGGPDTASALALSANGARVFVTGSARNDFVTAVFSTVTGRRLWASRYGNPGRLEPARAIAAAPDGSVYVTGAAENGLTCGLEFTITEYATVGYDGDTGNQLWAARYDGTRRYGPDTASAVAVADGGARVLVTGTSDDGCSSTPGDVATVSYMA